MPSQLMVSINWLYIRVNGIQKGMDLKHLWEHNDSKLVPLLTLPPSSAFLSYTYIYTYVFMWELYVCVFIYECQISD